MYVVIDNDGDDDDYGSDDDDEFYCLVFNCVLLDIKADSQVKIT